MQCNIDARGKALRLMIGVTSLAAAAVLAVLCLTGVLGSAWWWVAVAGTAGGGVFTVFEARTGWCAVRAMGFNTPI